MPRAPGVKPMGTTSKLVALYDPAPVLSAVAVILLASAGCGSNGARSTATTASAATSSSSSTASSASTNDFQLRAVVAVPDKPLTAFDISWVDASRRRYYLADRSNAGVDVVDTRTNQFVRRLQAGFAGADPRGNDFSGPNGVVVIHTTDSLEKDRDSDGDERGSRARVDELWAGDGPQVLNPGEAAQSSVKVFDLSSNPPVLVATVPTGGERRSDEIAFDSRDHLIAVVNNADDPPFLSLISTTPPRKVKAKITFAPGNPGFPFKNTVTGGLEQPLWVERTGRLYVSVPELDGDSTKGAVAQIDPVGSNGSGPTVTALFPVSDCSPAGLTLGPGLRILVGCADPSRSIILDAKTGAVLKTILDVGGSDEVWFNPGDEHYYLAARNDPSGPSLGIIDAGKNAFIAKVPTAFNAHSLAADQRNNHVFVPLTPPRAGKTDPDPCVSFGGASFAGRGCIGVYWSPVGEDEDNDD